MEELITKIKNEEQLTKDEQTHLAELLLDMVGEPGSNQANVVRTLKGPLASGRFERLYLPSSVIST